MRIICSYCGVDIGNIIECPIKGLDKMLNIICRICEDNEN